ncbi:T9SS type A sorting domain-containing protein [Flavobacterium psychroterrae]|uniref:T9SS type A sorting domain-containing protein n=1 Tax=Flavobacterium psychroterrae TaxID=2133767 RepID=A0ABS5PDJ8_9FLAO|nr:LamG-like jellyroll fold domain-containing protein [Flavobacterium psychroterrae]MBS7232363.1 T9SS type A sorting domain-containing protein [Flavobacterium psychroterrae]
MNKTLLFTLLLANFFFANASTRITAYRWRNNNGTETTATWKALLNTPVEITNFDALRIRIAVEETSTGNSGATLGLSSKIQFSDNNGSSWQGITIQNSPFIFEVSPDVAHETATTQQLATGDPGSFVPGLFFSADSNSFVGLPASQGKFTEQEFSLKPTAFIKAGVTYTFRIDGVLVALNIPKLISTVGIPCVTPEASVASPQKLNINTKVSDLVATGTDIKWYADAVGGTPLDVTTPLSTGLYYVSQTLSCESLRTEVEVNIVDLNGTSLEFQGGYVELPNSMPATYTKEAWIKINNFSPVNNIISGGSVDGEHAIYVPGGVLSSGHNGNYKAVEDSEQLNADTWYHVAVTYDLATTTMILYKNGVAIDENNNVPAFIGSLVMIGAFDPGQNLFNGAIDEVRIWNKVLTLAEIQNNMNCELSGAQPGLINYYKFNQGVQGGDNSAVSTLTDSSGNGNDGALADFDLSAGTSNWITGSIIQTGSTCTTLSVGDHNQEFASSLKVYPNPSSSAFFINSDTNGTAVLFDILGKTIQTQKVNSGTTALNLGSIPNGIYLLKITNENNQSKTVKLIKN